MDYLKENKWFVVAGASTILFSSYLLKDAFSKLSKLTSSNSTVKNTTDLEREMKSPRKVEEQTFRTENKIPFYRICLTGGPCAGKTSGNIETNKWGFDMKIKNKYLH
jgi:hypothetical protein